MRNLKELMVCFTILKNKTGCKFVLTPIMEMGYYVLSVRGGMVYGHQIRTLIDKGYNVAFYGDSIGIKKE